MEESRVTQNHSILEDTISNIRQERAAIAAEQDGFREFREHVRLTKSDRPADGSQAKSAEQLREAFQTAVMEVDGYTAAYGPTLAENLREEFSPALADALLEDSPFPQRRKRDLLVECKEALERRERFDTTLEDELQALETVADELETIEETIDRLPPCTPQRQPFERLLDVWEVYETLEERCAVLLDVRQQQLRMIAQRHRGIDEVHALSSYLYGDLETPYPVLSAIAATLARVDTNRDGRAGRDSRGRPLEA